MPHFDVLQGFMGYFDIYEEGPGGPNGEFTYGGFVRQFGGDEIASVSGKTSRSSVAVELRAMVERHVERIGEAA